MYEQLELFPDLEMTKKHPSKEYGAFTDKFKLKHTTDDCYTPEPVYNAVKDWVVNEFKLQGREIVRPFWSGGDFETFDYPRNCVVIDNPPFSLYKHILNFYEEEKIEFFLFAPQLTLFCNNDFCFFPTNEGITYKNGAKVNTAFVTSLDKENRIRNDVSLKEAVKKANEFQKVKIKKNSVLKYPDCVVSSALLGKTSRVDYRIKKEDTAFISIINGYKIFGNSFLLSDRAAADRAAADRAAADRAAAIEAKFIELGAKELEIIKKLNEKGEND